MKKESDILMKELLRKKEREFVLKSVNEAMREMGYDLLDETERAGKSKKRTRAIYRISGKTVLNVIHDESGKITMEVGHADTVTRKPEAREIKELTSDMISFCASFDKIEQALAKRGISTDKIEKLEPSPDNARIINIGSVDEKKREEIIPSAKTDKYLDR